MLGFDPLSGAPLSALGAPAAGTPNGWLAGFGMIGCGTGCACPTACAPTDFRVYGCGSNVYPGLTVSVYASSGGALITSGTTNASSIANLSLGASGNYWVTVTGQNARFAAYAQTHSAILCGSIVSLVLSPASGYNCFPALGCAIPWASTIYASGNEIPVCGGAFTGVVYTYTGLPSYNSGAFVGGGRGGISGTGILSGTCSGFGGFLTITCPPSFVATFVFGTINYTFTE